MRYYAASPADIKKAEEVSNSYQKIRYDELQVQAARAPAVEHTDEPARFTDMRLVWCEHAAEQIMQRLDKHEVIRRADHDIKRR